MAEERKGFWKSLADGLAPDPDVLASGQIDKAGTVLRIYRDGTFTTKRLIGGTESPRERLLSIEHDADSMRRKSMTGRGTAAVFTGGMSLFAANNRGVIYVTVVGDKTGVRTYTTRNPDGHVLTAIRSLKVAGDAVIAQTNAAPAPPPAAPAPGPSTTAAAPAPPASSSEPTLPAQLRQLAELLEAGVLTREEFDAAKARLLAE
ncbi:SHOCT domain-containing protein [Nocardioides sp. SYSU D00038]|uniref:SHOCT domain-containing protein n=1 Tax=Nocardioides sp. SYSU D00038 TaxID=2812554 RepID=UPI001967E1BB|nr:SHOCT domain-containing protein [Nocardioides sp. SYSU D00038]